MCVDFFIMYTMSIFKIDQRPMSCDYDGDEMNIFMTDCDVKPFAPNPSPQTDSPPIARCKTVEPNLDEIDCVDCTDYTRIWHEITGFNQSAGIADKIGLCTQSESTKPKFNHAINALGFDTVKQYFRELIKNIGDLQIVSVGSGDCGVEALLEAEFSRQIICVDPVKTDKVNYSIVSELLDTRPELQSNCVVFINWSLPNESRYDYDAIVQLQPIHVITIFESTGSGGGKIFQKWLNYNGIETDDKFAESDVIEHGFDKIKYNVTGTTYCRKIIEPMGMFEYEIAWLSRDIIILPSNAFSLYVGKYFEREQYNPVNTFLDMMMSSLSGLGKSYGMSNQMDRLRSDFAESIQRKLIEQKEKETYDGYLKPQTILSMSELDNITEQIDIASLTKSTITIECHHPYYRKMIRSYAISHGYATAQSVVVRDMPKNDDSMLLYHFNCKKCTPVAKVRWYPDYAHTGEIYQMQANCDHCEDKILSDYKNDVSTKYWGYKYVRGKNAVMLKWNSL